jgi:hypothetical protein
MTEERATVLRMLKDGAISVEEAEALLDALSTEPASVETGASAAISEPATAPDSTAGVPPRQERPGEQGSAPGREEQRDDAGLWRDWAGWSSWRYGTAGREIGRAVREAMRSVQEGVGPSMREALRELRREFRSREGRLSSARFVRDLFGLASAGEDTTLAHPAPAGGRLLIRNPRGNVRIGRSPDSEIHVRARKQTWGRDEAAAREALGRVRLSLAPAGSDVALVVEPAAWEPWRLRVRVDLDVDLPADVPVAMTLMRGDVEVREHGSDVEATIRRGDFDAAAPVRDVRVDLKSGRVTIGRARSCALRVMHGDVRIGPVEAGVDVYVASGNVRVDTAGGDLRAEVVHGGLRVARAASAHVRVVHGDVWVGSAAGDVDARVNSGDLDVGIAGAHSAVMRLTSGDATVRVARVAPGGRVSAEVVSGDITVGMAPEVRAAVLAEARSGRVDCELPLQDATRSHNRVRGVHGGADATVSLSTVSGNVSLTTQAASPAGAAG